MHSNYQVLNDHPCHSIKTFTEIIVVPLHYLALYHHYAIALWASLAALLAYTVATYAMHTARAVPQESSPVALMAAHESTDMAP